jgi:hypothetical protein
MKYTTLTEATVEIFYSLSHGQKFFGNELHDKVTKIYPLAEKKYPDTILRIMRRYFHNKYIVVSKQSSLYQKI